MRPADNINNLIKKLHLKASADLDKRVHDDISAALAESEKTKSVQTGPNIWRIIMKSQITKLAAAAVIIIAVFFALNFLSSGSGVAWAEVLNNVQNVHTFINRMKMTIQSSEGSQDVDMTFYRSTKYGTRRDSYYNEELISQLYIPAKGNRGIELVPGVKQYVEAVFTD